MLDQKSNYKITKLKSVLFPEFKILHYFQLLARGNHRENNGADHSDQGNAVAH